MIEQLKQLLAVTTIRAGRARTELAQRSRAFDEVAEELAAVDAQRRQIDQQQAAWERHWRQWLRENGILHHGQDYNLYHIKLSAWRREIEEQRADVERRYRCAERELEAARLDLHKKECQSDAIRQEFDTARRAVRAHRTSLVEANAIEELISHRHASASADLARQRL